MNRFTLEKRWDLLEICFKNKDNWLEIALKLQKKNIFSGESNFHIGGYLISTLPYMRLRKLKRILQLRHLPHHENRFFIPALHDINVNDVWFQWDGATCHTSHATIDLLR